MIFAVGTTIGSIHFTWSVIVEPAQPTDLNLFQAHHELNTNPGKNP